MLVQLLIVIRQGDRIALQTHIKENWLSCWRDRCDTSNCPGAIFDGPDGYKQCMGEAFQIFKPSPGEIRSGDLVGFYTPYKHGYWFSCASTPCLKGSCPGSPNTHYGFANKDLWYRCNGEEFKIYAYRKPVGSIITSGDDIMLYSIYHYAYVNGEGAVEGNNHCPGSSPPQEHKFDTCAHEVFTIIKH